MSNKKSGTDFEKEFCQLASKAGFWAHILQDNRNGQPADIILSKDNIAVLVDCKDCERKVFPLSRIEENQELAMRKWLNAGNEYALFALKIENDVRILIFKTLIILRSSGVKQLNLTQILEYSYSFESWAGAFNADNSK